MLSSLHIENIALLKCTDISFSDNFNALTGETGAGKSILIDSIGLILGDRFDKTLLRTGEENACVEAHFTKIPQPIQKLLLNQGINVDQDGSLTIKRYVSADGKSKIRLHDNSTLSLAQLKAAGQLLVGVLGQGDHQLLDDSESYIGYLDNYAHIDTEKNSYLKVYEKYVKIKQELASITKSESERLRTEEMLTYQLKDIDTLALKPGEDTLLYEKEQRIKGAERLVKNARFAYLALKGSEKASAAYIIDRSILSLEKIRDIIPDAQNLIDDLKECLYRIEDTAEKVHDFANDPDVQDPTAMLDKIGSRLSAIERLKRKYGATVDDILAYRAELAQRLDALENADERIAELNKQLDVCKSELTVHANVLHSKREKAANDLALAVIESLNELDMKNVRFTVDVIDAREECEGDFDGFTENGFDTVQLMLSANKGETLRPLARCASGGEMARIMLALRTACADKDGVPTLIFDEADTGVSGKTSRRLGLKLLKLSKDVQVLCVTHSAQVASLADTHMLIQKRENNDRTETIVTTLDENGRINELSRILGGIEITAAQIEAAKDMLTIKSE